MAINPINAPAGRAKESTLDKILKGLQIAESVFKIPVNYQQYRAYEKEADLKGKDVEAIESINQGQPSPYARLKHELVTVPAKKTDSPLLPPSGQAPSMEPPKADLAPPKSQQPAMNVPGIITTESGEFLAKGGAIKDFVEGTGKLRQEWDDNKTTQKTMQSYAAGRAAVKILEGGGSGPKDIAGIYKFMHTIEPDSIVKEGEYSLAQRAGGLMQWALGKLSEAKGKGGLTPTVRYQMKDAVKELVNIQLEVQEKIDARYRALAEKRGYDPEEVVYFKFEPFAAEEKQALAPNAKPSAKPSAKVPAKKAQQNLPGWSDKDEKRLQELESKVGKGSQP